MTGVNYIKLSVKLHICLLGIHVYINFQRKPKDRFSGYYIHTHSFHVSAQLTHTPSLRLSVFAHRGDQQTPLHHPHPHPALAASTPYCHGNQQPIGSQPTIDFQPPHSKFGRPNRKHLAPHASPLPHVCAPSIILGPEW